MQKLYVCKICGEPYIGGSEPDDCPFCGAPKNYIKYIEEYEEIWNVKLTAEEKNMIKETLDLEINASAYYKKVAATQKKYSEYERLFKGLFRVESEHASIAAKFLGISTPEFVGEDSKGSIKKDLKRTHELEKDAVEKYTRFLKDSINIEVKNFFAALIHAEKGHETILAEKI